MWYRAQKTSMFSLQGAATWWIDWHDLRAVVLLNWTFHDGTCCCFLLQTQTVKNRHTIWFVLVDTLCGLLVKCRLTLALTQHVPECYIWSSLHRWINLHSSPLCSWNHGHILGFFSPWFSVDKCRNLSDIDLCEYVDYSAATSDTSVELSFCDSSYSLSCQYIVCNSNIYAGWCRCSNNNSNCNNNSNNRFVQHV